MNRYFYPTLKDYDGLNAELSAIAACCTARGTTIVQMPLSQLQQEAQAGDHIFLQATSGYHLAIADYIRTLTLLEKGGCILHNPAATIRWNADKHYLQALENAGHTLVPTQWLAQGTSLPLAHTLHTQGWQEAVIKPCVSAGAYHTRRIHIDQATDQQAWLDTQLATHAMMLQPFVPEITSEGEWSLLFFGGTYSHTVLKTAKAGDYRIQHIHGGSYQHVTPDEALLDDATRVLHSVAALTGSMPDYARIDGIRRDGRLMLMEVELIEPFLYFSDSGQEAKRYVEALLA